MAYENITNITGLGDMIVYANTATSDVLGIAILFLVYTTILIYLIFRNNSPLNSFISAGWVNSIMAVFLFYMGLINNYSLFICVAMLVIPITMKYLMSE
jgi:hypothetical protein